LIRKRIPREGLKVAYLGLWVAGYVTLYKLDIDGIIRQCVVEHERPMILVEAHDGIVGGNYEGKETTQKIL
jgi:hypothetical protein